MRKTITHYVASSFLVIGVLGMGTMACEREEKAVGATPQVQVMTARQQISEARCDLEQRCNKIGAGRDYADRGACITKVQQNWKDELSFQECPGGVNGGELQECLTEIRNSSCGNPLDTLGRVTACRSSDLCKAM